jgi:hypothetical protein
MGVALVTDRRAVTLDFLNLKHHVCAIRESQDQWVNRKAGDFFDALAHRLVAVNSPAH